MLVISATLETEAGLRQEGRKFKASFGSLVRPCLPISYRKGRVVFEYPVLSSSKAGWSALHVWSVTLMQLGWRLSRMGCSCVHSRARRTSASLCRVQGKEGLGLWLCPHPAGRPVVHCYIVDPSIQMMSPWFEGQLFSVSYTVCPKGRLQVLPRSLAPPADQSEKTLSICTTPFRSVSSLLSLRHMEQLPESSRAVGKGASYRTGFLCSNHGDSSDDSYMI